MTAPFFLTEEGRLFSLEHLAESGINLAYLVDVGSGNLVAAIYWPEGIKDPSFLKEFTHMAKSFAERLLAQKKAERQDNDAASDEELANTCPHVHELLTKRLMDGKRQLEPASVTVFARSGSFHACLSHKGLGLKWWGEGATVEAALKALEAAVGKEEGGEVNTNGHTRAGRV